MEGPFSERALLDVSLFSTLLFVFSALLVQFLLNQYTVWLLSSNSVYFQSSLFTINYSSESKWAEDQIYFIFGSGPVILSAIGFILLFVLGHIRMAGWKTKLALTWLTFMLVNILPCSMVAGVFFYDGFGIAFHWFTSSYIARGAIALTVFMIAVLLRRHWQWLFLKTSYTSAFLDIAPSQRTFLEYVYYRPWIYGLLILLFFNWPFTNFFWRAFLLCYGFVAIPLLDHRNKYYNIHITKLNQKKFSTRPQVIFLGILLLIIWIGDNFFLNY